MDNMTEKKKDLPDFEKPPLNEVALSVQFESMSGLQAPQQGLLWAGEFRDQFPLTEQHPPVDPIIENFGLHQKGSMRLELVNNIPSPRCWFLNDKGSELIQIQQDRFTHNWRKVKDSDTYPRYESVREKFVSELKKFSSFVDKENLGNFIPVQCAVTYINHIVAEKVWEKHCDADKVFTSWSNSITDGFLGDPEQVRFSSQYILFEDDEPWGRLHVTVQSAFRSTDNMPLFVMEITARGRPKDSSIEGVIKSINDGRENIVRGFADLTTAAMHKLWGRKQ